MSSLSKYKSRMAVLGTSAGTTRKNRSDLIMEQTWDLDIETRQCYIYDYYHDRDKDKLSGYDPSTDENKYAVSTKFIIYQYGTAANNDQVEYHIQFKPSQKVKFEETDDLYYYETDFVKRYGAEFPIGLYIDIPDDTGVYRKWMIVARSISNQFPKYTVLPCNHNFIWIENRNKIRYKRQMYGLARFKNSYSSGIWTDNIITTVQNQDQFWIPSNDISDRIYYDQRLIISDATYIPEMNIYPLAWKISKVETIHPLGLKKFTLSQDKFDTTTDYVELDPVSGDIIAMYADYYSSAIVPSDDDIVVPIVDYSVITSSGIGQSIKVGGGYKTFTAKYYNSQGIELSTYTANWSCYVDGVEITTDKILKIIDANTYKLKINNTKDYDFGDDLLGKILIVYCDKGLPTESKLELDILAL